MRWRTCCLLSLLLSLLCAVPFAAAQTTSLLSVSGTVYEDNLPSQKPIQVTVRNLDRAEIVPAVTTLGNAGTGKFNVVFLDLFGNQIMGAVGDRLEVKLTDPNTGQIIETVEHTVLESEIIDGVGKVLIDIHMEIANALVFREIETQYAKQDHLLAFRLELIEPPAEVEFGMVDPPAGAQVDLITGVFGWVPEEDQIGDHEIQFTATADGQIGFVTVQIKVVPLFPTTTSLLIEGIAYDAPNAPTQQDVTVHAENLSRPDVSGSVQVGAAGPGRFSLLLSDPIDGRVMGQSGDVLEVRAVLGDGEELVSVLHEITDDDIVTGNGVIVLDLQLNRDPVLNLIGAQIARIGQNFRLVLEASDPDGDTLLFSSTVLPSGASLDAHQGVFQWVPRTEGVFGIKFEVTDGKEGYDEQEAEFTILPNSAPVFDPIPSIPSAEANVPLEIVLSAHDSDGDDVLYLVTGAPVGIDFSQTTGRFFWIPTEADVGVTYELTFGALDPYNALSTFSAEITVLAFPTYHAEMSIIEPSTVTIEDYLGSAEYHVRIINLGSRQDTFQLALAADEALIAALEPTQVTLQPGETMDLELLVRTQQRTPPGDYQTTVHAISMGDPEQEAQIAATTVVLVHPVLEIEPEALQFDTLNSERALLIRNAGTGTVKWQILELPAWLHADVTTGETAEEAQVMLSADLANLDPGDYSAAFQVADSAGTEVPVTAQLTVFEPWNATLKLAPDSQEVDVGTRATVALQIESDTPISYLEFGFAFDPSILQFVELSSDSEQIQWDYGRINNEVGQTTRPYEVLAEDGSALNGLDLQLHFEVVGAGSTAISLLRLLLQADDLRTDFRITKIPAKVNSIVSIPPWDINADGITDIVDLVFVGQHFGETGTPEGDVNGDSVVDILDLVIIGSHFGEQWEQLAAPARGWVQTPLTWQLSLEAERIVGELRVSEPIQLAGWSLELTHISSHLEDFQIEMGRDWASDAVPHHTITVDDTAQYKRVTTARLASGNAIVTGTLVRVSWPVGALADSQALLRDTASQVQLSARLVDATGKPWSWYSMASGTQLLPERSLLGPNFPNPFNPETWIPFQLSDSGDTHIRIYNAQGQLIRTLALGPLAAGIYETRERAAYWDGRDQIGNRVASGIYFYQLEQGSFSALRRCVIRK